MSDNSNDYRVVLWPLIGMQIATEHAEKQRQKEYQAAIYDTDCQWREENGFAILPPPPTKAPKPKRDSGYKTLRLMIVATVILVLWVFIHGIFISPDSSKEYMPAETTSCVVDSNGWCT